jgi:hypothetical protein
MAAFNALLLVVGIGVSGWQTARRWVGPRGEL